MYKNAVRSLNNLQTNFSVIESIHNQCKQNKAARDAELIPEMFEWLRRSGLAPPDLDALHPVHITGTKGKGSTAAFVQSIFLQYAAANNDINVGLYTSPHLKSVRERIMVMGKPISEEKFAKYFFEVFNKLDSTSSDLAKFPKHLTGIKPMYFRFLTLVSFHAMLQEHVNHAIYEVGIGGEYDSTNLFVHPAACGVTSLGLDHTQVLGNTLGEIAWNKAGIFKRGAPAFTIDDQPAEAMRVLRERAAEKQVSKFETVPIHPHLKTIQLGLRGSFQQKNATLACYLAAERLGIELDPNTLPPQFVAGLEQASWPGRCQVLTSDKAEWFIDGAHTAESLALAAEWFAETVDWSQPISLVFNQQKRDNVDELLTGLHTALTAACVQVNKAYFTTNQTHAWGFDDDMISHNVSAEQVSKLSIQKQLAAVWSKLDPSCEIVVCSDLDKVISQAEGQVFATGSLLMIGGLLLLLE